jgi:hypothetical protein
LKIINKILIILIILMEYQYLLLHLLGKMGLQFLLPLPLLEYQEHQDVEFLLLHHHLF